jgi:hypothetical protein
MAMTASRATSLVVALAAAGTLVLATGPATAAAAEGPPLTGTYLPGTAGVASQAFDVAAGGAVAGVRTPPAGTPEATVWRRGRPQALPTPGEPIPGYRVGAQATKVAGGFVAGTSLADVMSPGQFLPGTPARWHAGATVTFTAGPLGAVQDLTAQGWAVATGHAGAGHLNTYTVVLRPDGTTFQPAMVGVALDRRGRVYGHRYVANRAEAVRHDGTAATVLPAPDGRSAAVRDVTRGGTACGSAFTQVPVPAPRPAVDWVDHAPLLWRPDGTRVELPALGAESRCTHIAGTVAAGLFERADGLEGAVLWTGGAAVGVGPVGAETVVTGVNAAGVVVGHTRTTPGAAPVGFVATATAWRPLTAPGATYTVPSDVNDAGTVVGTAYDASGNPRATRWTAPRPQRP